MNFVSMWRIRSVQYNHNLAKAIHRSGMTCDPNSIVFGHTPAGNSHSLYRQQLSPPSTISAIDFENYSTLQSSAIPKNIKMIGNACLTNPLTIHTLVLNNVDRK